MQDTVPHAEAIPAVEPHPVEAAALPFDFEAAYEQYVPVMIGMAVRRYGIPESEAETLAHEVLVDLLLKADRVTDLRAWLIASMSNASRYYRRVRARSEALPDTIEEKADPDLARVIDMWPDRLAGRQAFACTTARCQLVLRLRFFEQYTVPEIAEELGITNRYATKLLGECLRQAHRRYTKMGRGGE